jgi:thiamine biosynthesis protein ThiS
MEFGLNGEVVHRPRGTTILHLIEHLSYCPDAVAVMLNDVLLDRTLWPETMLCEGDQVDIVRYVHR